MISKDIRGTPEALPGHESGAPCTRNRVPDRVAYESSFRHHEVES